MFLLLTKASLTRFTMQNEHYLAYIANFVENVATLASKHEWRKYLESEYGSTNIGDIDEDNIQKLARHLYRSYVLSHFTRHSAFSIAERLTDKQIEEFLKAELVLDAKYKMEIDTISTDLSLKAIDRHIKNNGETKYKSILAKLDLKNSPTRIKAKAAAERAAKKKPTAKKPVKKTPASTTKKTVKKTTTKKPAATAKKTSSSAPKKSAATKSCNAHSVKELKELAKARGKSGYSKMNKDDLCKLLKIA